MSNEYSISRLKAILIGLAGIASISAVFLFFGYVPSGLNPGLLAGDRAAFVSSSLGSIAAVLALAVAGLLGAMQLASELEARADDRKLAAKREIIIDGVRGLTKILAQIGRLANPNVDFSDVSNDYADGVSMVAPMFAILEPDSVAVLQDISDDAGSNYVRLSLRRNEIMSEKHAIEFREKLIKDVEAEQDRLLEELRQSDAAGNTELSLRIHAMLSQSRISSRQMHLDLDDPRDAFSEKAQDLLLACLKENRRLRNKYRRLLAELRVEIGVDKRTHEALALFIYVTRPDDDRFVEIISAALSGEHRDEIAAFATDNDVDNAFSADAYPPRSTWDFRMEYDSSNGRRGPR